MTDSGRLSPLPPCSCKTEGVTDLSKDNAGQDDFDIQNMCLCKDQEVSTTYASNFSQRNEEIFQPNLVNICCDFAASTNRKMFLFDFGDVYQLFDELVVIFR